MQYTEFGKLGFNVSRFGMGCMRLPVIEKSNGGYEVNEPLAIKMIHYAVDNGVNYLDTAYPYHGGTGEVIVGKALKEGYRDKVKLTTKLPGWRAKTYHDFEKILDEQLKKLQVDSLDFYLIHSLHRSYWDEIYALGVLDFFDRVKEKGKIRYAGFSFHDGFDTFKDIIDSYSWDMCQIQLNILDENYQAGVQGLKYAGSRGIPVVIMEPLKGGSLVNNVPQEVMDIFNGAGVKRSPAEWAFRWLSNFPEVTAILSGVSTMEQLKDNLRIFSRALPNSMTEEELKLVAQVKEIYRSKIKVGCTACRYCMPCPQSVFIFGIFSMYNGASMYGDMAHYAAQYREIIETGKNQGKMDATFCIECGKCEKACPQNIPIMQKLKEADAVLRGIEK